MDITRFTKIANFIIECIKEAVLEESKATNYKSPITTLIESFGAKRQHTLKLPKTIPQKPPPQPQMPKPQENLIPNNQEDMQEDKPEKKD